jgi:glucose-1-phosphate thymidylyltransferase
MAGGSGSRLLPLTKGVNKHLLPIYDKPLIHYPLATLMAAGIREISLIVNPQDQESYIRLLGTGDQFGVSFNYITQKKPGGIAQGILLAKDFLLDHKFALILGDNIFHGPGLGRHLMRYQELDGAKVFAYRVSDPENYGVVDFDENNKIVSIEEKPQRPKSNYVIPGLYFYDSNASRFAAELMPSARGELEITDLNRRYLIENQLDISVLPRGTAWLDTGTVSSLHDASTFVRILEERQGSKVSCLEEVAWNQGWINDQDLTSLAKSYGETPYGEYLRLLPSAPLERGI